MDEAARHALLEWYAANQRDLPWRHGRDPYAIWVSEVMLQQTRVDVVVPHFERWMRRFPSIAALAGASEADVLAAWSGLGYYRRARSLHAAARDLVQRHGGALPADAARLRELPGFGPYTAGAVASIAFGRAEPCVDGNVLRVGARVLGLRDAPSAASTRAIEGAARAWVLAACAQGAEAGTWNQAVMELGATVCTPRSPSCDSCPVRRSCRAAQAGEADAIPAPRRRAAPRHELHHAALVETERGVLLVKAPAGLLGGLWRLPGGLRDDGLAGLVERQTAPRRRAGHAGGMRVELATKPHANVRHAFSHRTWELDVHTGRLVGPAPSRLPSHVRFVPRAHLGTVGLSAVMRKAIEAVPAR